MTSTCHTTREVKDHCRLLSLTFGFNAPRCPYSDVGPAGRPVERRDGQPLCWGNGFPDWHGKTHVSECNLDRETVGPDAGWRYAAVTSEHERTSFFRHHASHRKTVSRVQPGSLTKR